MDSRATGREHKLNIVDRQKVQITGITKIISIEEQHIVLITDVGRMTINGKNLHAGKLDVVSGILELTGCVDGITYQENKTAKQKASGIVGRLFK